MRWERIALALLLVGSIAIAASITNVGPGATTAAGGADTEVQYNSGGALTGNANLAFNPVTASLILLNGSTNPATSGAIALPYNTFIKWRNSDDSANVALGLLTIGGVVNTFSFTGSQAAHAAPDNDTPQGHTFIIGDSARAGVDANTAGGDAIIHSGNGTGNATGSSLIFQTPTAGSIGSTAETLTDRFTLNETTATFLPPIKLTPLAAPPATCAAGTEGEIYSDSSHALCWCDSGTWQKISGAGTCS